MKQNKTLSKNYATKTCNVKSCFFRLDYSYSLNKECLGCEFCQYKITPSPKELLRNFYRYKSEKLYNSNLYKTPIILSRNCDPLFSSSSIDVTYKIAKDYLENNGQVIFKTSQHNIPDNYIELFNEYKNNVLIQLRVVSDDTYLGDIVRETMSPKFSSTKELLDMGEELIGYGLDVSFIIDPYIIGVNDKDVFGIINKAYARGIKKFTIKQLFSTQYFKIFLSKMIDNKFVSMLSDEYLNKYYTYDNITFIGSLYPILEKIQDLDVKIGICCNKYVNELVNKMDNCCLFDNPIGIYNPDIHPMNRSNKNLPLTINLRDKNNVP